MDRSRADDIALAEFRYQLRRFLHFSESAAREAGVVPQQHQLLLAVSGMAEGPEPTIATLAERLQLRHNSTVELVDRCERKRLVSRHRGAEDSREVRVRLTPKGSRLLKRLTDEHRRELRSRAPALIAALQSIAGDASARRVQSKKRRSA